MAQGAARHATEWTILQRPGIDGDRERHGDATYRPASGAPLATARPTTQHDEMASGARNIVKQVPVLYRGFRSMRLRVGSTLPPRRVDGLPGRVHRNDLMLTSLAAPAVESYARLGRQAVDLIDEAVELAGRRGSLEHALDLGCGHGRVLRVLRERHPELSITACDLDREAVTFCAREFAAVPLLGSEDFEAIPFDDYDLVWMGSLLTHLPTERWHQLASVIGAILRPEGVVVFSTHGEQALHQLDHYGPGLEARRLEIVEPLRRSGHVYVPYRHYSGDTYGVAFHTTDDVDDTIVSALGGASRRLLFRSAGWGGHQDVHAFQKLR